jgi:hypothetical protein
VIGVEVVIGFAVGYWIGTHQGREGIQKALDSAQAIWASPETRRLLSEGLSAFETAAAPAMARMMNGKSNGGKTALIGSVMDELIQRRQSRRAA